MVCENCGKEMIKVGVLTEQEQNDWTFIRTKENTTDQALNIETIKGMEFKDGEVFEYFRACFDAKAEVEFLRYIFFRDLKKRLNLGEGENIWLGDDYSDIGVFKHPEE